MKQSDHDFEEETTSTIAEAFDVMVEASGVVKRNADFLSKVIHSFYVRALKPMTYIVLVVLLIVILQQFSLIQRDKKIDQLTENVAILQKSADDAIIASREAKIAAEAAKSALDAAITNSQEAGKASEDAINRINDIYDTCVVRKEC